ncbi:hypothetical protein [Mycobacterium hubeiense]|nr:hypothetical protein [Mycobacterium sp. QGD 101]
MKNLIQRHWWALLAGWDEYRSQVRFIKNVVQFRSDPEIWSHTSDRHGQA